MKTKEFINRVEGLGYQTKETPSELSVWNIHNGEVFAQILKYRPNFLTLNSCYYSLIKLCLEYAETPIEEREDVKKYVVVLPDISNDGTYFYALVKWNSGIGIGKIHKSRLEGFTESEIKRNYEYLWQFAKEVECEPI